MLASHRRDTLLAPLAFVFLLAGCVQVGDGRLTMGGLFEKSVQPDTVPLTAPLEESFAYLDLLTGERGRMDVTETGPGSVRVEQSDGCVWTRSGDWFAPSDGWTRCDDSRNWHTGRAVVQPEGTIWPLTVGAEGRFTRRAVSHTGRSYTRETVCRVSDQVAVVREGRSPTPAFVVECNDGKRIRTTWYAPGEGPVAFHKMHRENGVEQAWLRL